MLPTIWLPISLVLANLVGTRRGTFFRFLPDYVNASLPPGFSRFPFPTFENWVRRIPLLLIVTPNGLWAAIALLFYVIFPYDLSPGSHASKSPVSLAFFVTRFPLWLILVVAYYGFWHVSLYGLLWANRPFVLGRVYSIGKTAHNIFWTCAGVAVWAVLENVFAYLWASGRISYVPDSTVLSTSGGAFSFLAALFLVPAWRDVHFFFAHRLLHWPPLYAAAHSLHHRNTDIEPFAGLAMHPVEHL